MTDQTSALAPLEEDADPADLGLAVDGDTALHEEAWAAIEQMAAGMALEYAPRLATVSSATAGLVYVKFDSEAEARTVGFAHALGLTFFPGQRCVVQKLAGGEYWVQAAYGIRQGPEEQVVTNKDLATDSVDARVISAGAVGTAEILSGSVTGGAGGSLAGATVALANLASDVQGKISASLQPSDVKDGYNRAGQHKLLSEAHVKGNSAGTSGNNQLATVGDLSGFYKEGNGDNAKVVTRGDLSAYVKSVDLADNADGKKALATEEWVKDNFAAKKKSND